MTCVEETPPFREQEHFFWVPKAGFNLHSGDTLAIKTYTSKVTLKSRQLRKAVARRLKQAYAYVASVSTWVRWRMLERKRKKGRSRLGRKRLLRGHYTEACFKRRATAVLSWLDCSSTVARLQHDTRTTWFQTWNSIQSNRIAVAEHKTQK